MLRVRCARPSFQGVAPEDRMSSDSDGVSQTAVFKLRYSPSPSRSSSCCHLHSVYAGFYLLTVLCSTSSAAMDVVCNFCYKGDFQSTRSLHIHHSTCVAKKKRLESYASRTEKLVKKRHRDKNKPKKRSHKEVTEAVLRCQEDLAADLNKVCS